jgi:hypothetical protein
MEHTVESMNSRFSGGPGKVKADPHDKYIFNEFEREIPKLVDTVKQVDPLAGLAALLQNQQKPSVDSDLIARLEAKERQLDETIAAAEVERTRLSQEYRNRFKKKDVTETVAA